MNKMYLIGCIAGTTFINNVNNILQNKYVITLLVASGILRSKIMFIKIFYFHNDLHIICVYYKYMYLKLNCI